MALSKHFIHALCSLGAKEPIISPPPSSSEIKANRERRQWDFGRDLGTEWSHLAGKEEEGGDGDRALQAKVKDGHLLRQKSRPASAFKNRLAEESENDAGWRELPRASKSPLPTTTLAGTGTQGCCRSPAFIPLAAKAQKKLRKSKVRDEACICLVHSS